MVVEISPTIIGSLMDATYIPKFRMKTISTILFILYILFINGCAAGNRIDIEKILTIANEGNAEAQNDLGNRYRHGDGVTRDYQVAIMWYEKSANQGLSLAKINLGYMHDLGLGVPKNKEKAILLYLEAANALEPRGMIKLSEMYQKGDGLPKSYGKAYMWLEIARFYTQKSNDMHAKWTIRNTLGLLKTLLTESQIKKYKQLAHDWINKSD